LTVTNIDPFTADAAGIVSFFVSFFLGLLGLVILLMMYINSRVSSVAQLYERMPVLVRQSMLISFGLTAVLGMQSMRVLRWWTAAMLVIILVLVEISFYADRLDFEEMLAGVNQKASNPEETMPATAAVKSRSQIDRAKERGEKMLRTVQEKTGALWEKVKVRLKKVKKKATKKKEDLGDERKKKV